MKISKIRSVKTPTRGTSLSAGIDFYVPFFDIDFCQDLFNKNPSLRITVERLVNSKMLKIRPQNRILIPSGIKVNFMDGAPRALVNFNKSGKSSNTGLDVLACVIDQDYQGEIHLSVNNNSNEDIIITEGEKLIQGLFLLISYEEIIEVPLENLYKEKTERSDGGFGSTGDK